MELRRKSGGRRGFTLVELLLVIIILSISASIVIPKIFDRDGESRRAARRANAILINNAITRFKLDTGLYPADIDQLAWPAADVTKGLNEAGNEVSVTPGTCLGPYLNTVPADPISKSAYAYSVVPPNVGKLTIP